MTDAYGSNAPIVIESTRMTALTCYFQSSILEGPVTLNRKNCLVQARCIAIGEGS
jgi:hypothetical protein